MPNDFPQLGSSRGETMSAGPEVPIVAGEGQQHGQALAAPDARPDRAFFARYGVARLLDESGEMRPIGALEEEVIRFAIGHYRGRMSEVARRLGIGRSTLYRKIKDYGIADGEPVAS
jgi:DNA-binding NtrC family response regulator